MVTKKIALIIFLICLNGCRSPQPITVKQCSPDIVEKICDCRDYHYSVDYVGPVKDSEYRADYSECQDLIGYPPDEYLKVVNYTEEARLILRRYKKRKNR